MKKEEIKALLKNNPVFWSRLGFAYDPPLKNERGLPLVFTEDLSRYGKYHAEFKEAGVKLHTCILHLGWMGVDEYDYSLTDRVLEEIFRRDPDGYFIPRIKLNVPVDWCAENPEEVFVYPGGPETAEEIRALVGTEKQDYIGYDAPNGYYMAGDYVDPRPNVGGLIARQSFASKKWLKDASVALEKLIDRLESSKYADRILAYHIAYGTSGECILWGRISRRYGDHGICNKRAFYEWGIKKYGSQEALAKAWCQPNVTKESLRLPSGEERYDVTDTVEGFFRARKEQTISTDLDLFNSEINCDAIEHFGRVVKEKAPEKLVGAFYGYVIHIDDAAYTGHCTMDRLLNSPYVDFFAAPKSYHRCQAGDAGGAMTATQSVNRKKLWLDELDNRTYLATGVEAGWESRGFVDTRTVFWREFAKNHSTGSGFWWMDLGGGWFDAPEIMNEFARLVKVNDRLHALPEKSAADVLVLIDDECIQHMNIGKKLRAGFMEDFLCDLHRTGCLSDTYLLSDLAELDLSRYKLIVFAYTFKMSEKQREVVKSISSDKLVMFNYAAGVIADDGVSLDNTASLTGIALEETGEREYDFPTLRVKEDAALDVLVRNEKGDALVAVRTDGEKRTVANVKAFLSPKELRMICDLAGCHAYAPAGNTVYGDARFLGVFPAKDAPLAGKVTMKDEGDYTDLISGKTFRAAKDLEVEIPAAGAAFFMKD